MRTLEQWERELTERRYAPATVAAKVAAVSSAATFAGVAPHELSADDVRGWLGVPGRATWTQLKYASHMRAWCGWAGMVDLTAGIRRPSQPLGVPRPVSEADLAAMLAAARPGRERAWVTLGAYAGLRAHESAKVCAGDLVAPAGQALLYVLGKGGKSALIPAAPAVVAVLRLAGAGVPAPGRLWPGATSAAVQAVIRAVGARAGVACSSHQLRHRYGTALYAGGRDLLATQRLMRHASPATTAGYALVSPDELAAAVCALPGAAGPPARAGLRLVPGGR